ncbi:ATP-binding cassette, subfamily B, bacterial RaxB [Vibrio crassostreae]|nr:ATP-binding cassette, subfamily B, bacterial RaxB [Vibrio crassostreae]CAK3418030.1 ATP-binding cassette, subfamily B, bacterial RaxB [Vibrio crassostreae]
MSHVNSLGCDSPTQVHSLLSYSVKKSVPLVLQNEVSECGLASLAMISSFHGYQIDLASIRRLISLDRQGMSLQELIEVSGAVNMAGRAVKCDIDQIHKLTLPCILHWNLDHFVVLTGVNNKHVYINDPAIGKRKLTFGQFSDSYTGIALELAPTTNFKKENVQQVIKIGHLWTSIKGLKRSLAALLSLSIVLQVFILISPYYIQLTIDDVLISNDHPLLVVLLVGFSFIVVAQVGVSLLRRWILLKLSSSLNIQMGSNLFFHLLRLPMEYFEKRHVGDVVSRFGSLNRIREMITSNFVEALMDGFMAIILLIMMFTYSSVLTYMVLGISLFSAAIQIAFFFPSRMITEETIAAKAKEDTIFLESIRAVQTIKLFSRETNRQSIWLNRYVEVINLDIRLGKLELVKDSLTKLLNGVEPLLVLFLGATAIMDGQFTIGMLLAFIAYKTQFTNSFEALVRNLLCLKLVRLHLERLSDIALQDKEICQTQSFSHSGKSSGSGTLRLRNVGFQYSDNSQWVFRHLSLSVEPGETVAITGASGSGKTTLLKVILGLLRPTEGEIFVGEFNQQDLPINQFRSNIGTVMQSDTLLSGTLMENISMFDTNIDEEFLIKCCEDACIMDEIRALPLGLNTPVGDMGSGFSGGQLQRIYLARALYKRPTLLCLDESTSHLDGQNESLINQNIKQLNITKIIIAHRENTIKLADRVIDLNSL